MPMLRPLLPLRASLVALFFVVAHVVPGLQTTPLAGKWTDALTLASLPDGSLLVAQTSGLIDRLAPSSQGFQEPTAWADLGDEGRATLLGLAIDPDFVSSGYLYAVLRVEHEGQPLARLTRWRVTEGSVILNKVLVDRLPSGAERPGGVLKLGPDGKLWLGLGDGGAPAAEVTANTLRGTLLRYDLDGDIPADNPQPDSPVWAWGLREPSGLAWHPISGRLYALDRGPVIPRGTMDELNLIDAGANYGWPKHLGREVVRGVTRPVIYCSSGHSWVPGGAVFLDQGEWKGSLLFAGAGEGILYRLSLDSKDPNKILFYEELINGDLGPLVDVTLAHGQPYLLSKAGLYQLKF